MSVTVRRPLYSGSGWALNNGSGLALTYEVTVESLEQAIYDLLTEVRAVVGGPGSTLAQLVTLLRGQIGSDIASFIVDTLMGGDPTPLQVATADDFVPITDWIANPANLFTAIQNVRLDTAEPHLPTIEDVLNNPVTLPETPPAGYGGASASDVWNTIVNWYWLDGTGNPVTVQDLLFNASALATLIAGSVGVPDPKNPDFSLVMGSAGQANLDAFNLWGARYLSPLPTVDWSAWNGTDTLLDFLIAQTELDEWTDTGPGGVQTPGYAWLQAYLSPPIWWRCNVVEWQLPYVSGRAAAGIGAVTAGAPVWPGESGVTFGTGVQLAAGVFIEQVMDGIQLNILSSDRQIPYVGAATYKLYRSMGRVAFMTDDGYLEAWQPVPADQCVMVPKSMTQASGVVLSFYTGVAGLVTPWTRNA